jgi:hypothetical protein
MRAALAIALEEVRTHRLVFWAGLALGVPAIVAVRGASGPEPFFVMAGAAAVAMAIGLGASVVSRDLGERRLGFYLSRPVSPLSYWAGKMGAALSLAITAGLLALVPGLLAGAVSLVDTRGFGVGTVAEALGRLWKPWLLILTFFVAGAAAAGGAIRSRSGLLILDVVMVPVAWIATLLALGQAWDTGTPDVVMELGLPWLLRALIVILLAAGAVQVTMGRLEARRGHALLSAIVWGGVLVVFVGGLRALSAYVGSAGPADLRPPGSSGLGWTLNAPRSGEPVFVEGISARWGSRYVPGFLLHPGGGFVRVGGADGRSGLAWAADGRHFALSRWEPFPQIEPLASAGLGPNIRIFDTASPERAPRRVLRKAPGPTESARAVSPSGDRLLLENLGTRTVIETVDGRTVAEAMDSASWAFSSFIEEGSLRALRLDVRQASVLDWDLATRQVTRRGAIVLDTAVRTWYSGSALRVWPTPDWKVVVRFDASGLFLHALDGNVVATLVAGWVEPRANRLAGTLSAGRVGLIEEEIDDPVHHPRSAGRLRLRVWDEAGRLVSDGRFDGRSPVMVGGEIAPGLLAIGSRGRDGRRATLFVDLATATVTRTEPDLLPALRRWVASAWDPQGGPEPGSFATRLFFDGVGLVAVDPDTGARSALITPRGQDEG